MIGFGVVGCGFISQTAHLPSLESIPEAETRIACDLREDVTKVIAERYRCDWTTDPDKVFERKDPEAASIVTPHASITSLALDALESGKYVIVEKPMAMSSKEGKTVNETASKCALKLIVAHMKRYDSGGRESQRRNSIGHDRSTCLRPLPRVLGRMGRQQTYRRRNLWHI